MLQFKLNKRPKYIMIGKKKILKSPLSSSADYSEQQSTKKSFGSQPHYRNHSQSKSNYGLSERMPMHQLYCASSQSLRGIQTENYQSQNLIPGVESRTGTRPPAITGLLRSRIGSRLSTRPHQNKRSLSLSTACVPSKSPSSSSSKNLDQWDIARANIFLNQRKRTQDNNHQNSMLATDHVAVMCSSDRSNNNNAIGMYPKTCLEPAVDSSQQTKKHFEGMQSYIDQSDVIEDFFDRNKKLTQSVQKLLQTPKKTSKKKSKQNAMMKTKMMRNKPKIAFKSPTRSNMRDAQLRKQSCQFTDQSVTRTALSNSYLGPDQHAKSFKEFRMRKIKCLNRPPPIRNEVMSLKNGLFFAEFRDDNATHRQAKPPISRSRLIVNSNQQPKELSPVKMIRNERSQRQMIRYSSMNSKIVVSEQSRCTSSVRFDLTNQSSSQASFKKVNPQEQEDFIWRYRDYIKRVKQVNKAKRILSQNRDLFNKEVKMSMIKQIRRSVNIIERVEQDMDIEEARRVTSPHLSPAIRNTNLNYSCRDVSKPLRYEF